jgi:hypothetical protein
MSNRINQTTRKVHRAFIFSILCLCLVEVREVIKGVKTSEETIQAGVDFAGSVGKEPFRVESDISVFLLNRIHLVC